MVLLPLLLATAIPIRVKAIFSGMVAFLVAPLWPSCRTRVNLGFSSLLGELAVGLVYGLALALLNEMMLFAGQIADCSSASRWSTCSIRPQISRRRCSRIVSADGDTGRHRRRARPHPAASMVRSFRVVPLGAYTLAPMAAMGIVRAAAGSFWLRSSWPRPSLRRPC